MLLCILSGQQLAACMSSRLKAPARNRGWWWGDVALILNILDVITPPVSMSSVKQTAEKQGFIPPQWLGFDIFSPLFLLRL